MPGYVRDVEASKVLGIIQTRRAEPRTIHVVHEQELARRRCGSPHFVGLFEAPTLGRALGLAVPPELGILAGEAADCLTLGGTIPRVVDLVRQLTPTPA